jgi:hypothetical protein
VESKNVFAEEVMNLGPPLSETFGVGAISDCCRVVDEGVVPDVEDMAFVPRNRNTP